MPASCYSICSCAFCSEQRDLRHASTMVRSRTALERRLEKPKSRADKACDIYIIQRTALVQTGVLWKVGRSGHKFGGQHHRELFHSPLKDSDATLAHIIKIANGLKVIA
ncbi:hypothetical protein WG66_017007 [Moniliophthora roreri]|nr:hypothetical protein WG66_017007 [Moniliophthora roreri]